MCLAIPGKVMEIGQDNGIRMGRVQFGGVVQPVSLEFTPEVVPGDYVLVHVGFALSRVDPEEAERTWQVLREMGMLEEEMPQETVSCAGNLDKAP
jgi:hydrogenase expression/formation protein HypC